MHIEISDAAAHVLQSMISSGQFETAEDAVNAVLLRKARGFHADNNAGETPFVKARRLGLIGAANGLPPDLSSNKTYFDGFGSA